MLFSNLPLVSWTNGTIVLILFGLVSIGLVIALLLLINSGKRKE